jgi:hypothetical protein
MAGAVHATGCLVKRRLKKMPLSAGIKRAPRLAAKLGSHVNLLTSRVCE